MTTAESKSTEMTGSGKSSSVSTAAGSLLDHIATASLLEEKFNRSSDADDGSDDEEDEEVFEDGDNDDNDEEEQEHAADHERHESVAAVLTELSQATAPAATGSTGNIPAAAFPLPSRPLPNTNMAATINSINAYLQSHLLSVPPAQPQKARLYGPIRANVNIRHGVWAPRLRCRKRKNLHAKDGIWINPTCTLEHLVYLVKSVLPDEFEWDPQVSPLRYQAVNDQSLQSLKTVSGTVASGQSLFAAFDLVRNRRSDGDNFILQLYVYGTWTVLLKPHNYPSAAAAAAALDEDVVTLPPPPKKKYQQAHYSHQQQMAEESQNAGMFHMRLSPPSNAAAISASASTSAAYYTHPLSANPPVTFLPTVTLEMKMNGVFVPVEISRRSFVSAIRACSMPKPSVNEVVHSSPVTIVNSSANVSGSGTPPPQTQSNNKNNNNNTNNNNSNNNTNITPPPSEA